MFRAIADSRTVVTGHDVTEGVVLVYLVVFREGICTVSLVHWCRSFALGADVDSWDSFISRISQSIQIGSEVKFCNWKKQSACPLVSISPCIVA